MLINILNKLFRIYYQIKQQARASGNSGSGHQTEADTKSNEELKQQAILDQARLRLQANENDHLFGKLGLMLRQLNSIGDLDRTFLDSFVVQLIEADQAAAKLKAFSTSYNKFNNTNSSEAASFKDTAQFSSSSMATSMTDDDYY